MNILNTVAKATARKIYRINRRSPAISMCAALILSGSALSFAEAPKTDTEKDNTPEAEMVKLKAKQLRKERALSMARKKMNRNDVSIIASSDKKFSMSNKSISRYKVVGGDGDVVELAFDKDGNEVDAEALFQREQAMKKRKYGKFSHELYEKLKHVKDDALPVVISFRVRNKPHLSKPEKLTGQGKHSKKASAKALIDKRAQMMAKHTLKKRRKLLKLIKRSDPQAQMIGDTPNVVASLSKSQLKRLSRSKLIDHIALNSNNTPGLSSSRIDTLATIANVNLGLRGDGVQIAQIEVGGIVNEAHQDLPANRIVQGHSSACESTLVGHPSEVAGVMMSTNSVNEGLSNRATLWAGGRCDSNGNPDTTNATARTITTNAVNWGARVINVSSTFGTTGSVNTTDQFFDRIVFDNWRTHVTIAGNRATAACAGGATVNTTVGNRGYNGIIVGAYVEGGVLWGDESVWPCSQWEDPTSGDDDRQEPALLAPGVSITTTANTGNNFVTRNGTSYSAPHVSATAAIMMEADPDLEYWPERVKAIILASTIGLQGSVFPERMHETIGNGRLDALAAVNVARGVNGGNIGTSLSCGTHTSSNPLKITIPVGGVNRARVVVNFPTDPDYVDYFSRPSMDVDFRVRRKSDNFILGSSATWDNTYEIVDFVTPFADTYDIEIWAARCGSSTASQYIGVAWHEDDI